MHLAVAGVGLCTAPGVGVRDEGEGADRGRHMAALITASSPGNMALISPAYCPHTGLKITRNDIGTSILNYLFFSS